MHEDYMSGGYQDNYDVALIKTEPFEIDGTDISVACLPDSGKHLTDYSVKCYAAGWGKGQIFFVETLISGMLRRNLIT